MKGYSTLPRSPELDLHHQLLFCVILRASLWWGCLTFLQSMQFVYSKPYQQSIVQFVLKRVLKSLDQLFSIESLSVINFVLSASGRQLWIWYEKLYTTFRAR